MSNQGFHVAMREVGITVIETAVGDKHVYEAMRDGGYVLGGSGRVLVRPSGTEPAIRLMVQAADAGLAEQVIGQLAAEIRLALAEHPRTSGS
jgi:phosphoglucosamine mutase